MVVPDVFLCEWRVKYFRTNTLEKCSENGKLWKDFRNGNCGNAPKKCALNSITMTNDRQKIFYEKQKGEPQKNCGKSYNPTAQQIAFKENIWAHLPCKLHCTHFPRKLELETDVFTWYMLSMGRSMSKRSPEIQEIRKKRTFSRFTRFTKWGVEVFSLANQMKHFSSECAVRQLWSASVNRWEMIHYNTL